ncbi:hypothetical protein [Anabaena azotica]|uniref:Uncharacterized protein n=1 Tax=Anabaena azotica FACHB-119 TaxID=947527 RepID=A0ABR8D629_9NOST|nr:hypothetical protein [Anabaena azotica]MBD2502159.1 hypothetical protein [Anabaena azotica FACHB-119]
MFKLLYKLKNRELICLGAVEAGFAPNVGRGSPTHRGDCGVVGNDAAVFG